MTARRSPLRRGPNPASRDLVPHDQRRYVLTPQEHRFVEEYLIDLDPRAASGRANLAPDKGKTLLARPKIQEAIALARRRRLGRLQIYGDEIVRRWAALASADPNELVEMRRVNCRNCNGVDFEPQYTDLEYRHALAAHRQQTQAIAAEHRRNGTDPDDDPRLVPFDERGGAGFRHNGPPNPACPNCDGDGLLKVLIKDSRYLSPQGKLLYDGVKVTAGGVEVKMRDRSWAEQMLARHAGLFNEREPIHEFNPDRMSDEQLDSVLHSMIEHGQVTLDATPADYEDVSEATPPSMDDSDA